MWQAAGRKRKFLSIEPTVRHLFRSRCYDRAVRERSWTLVVRDERGRRHRGIVTYGTLPPTRPPEPPYEFHIALLTAPASVRSVPGATAVCVPHLARGSVVADEAAAVPSVASEVVALKQGRMSEAHHAQFRAGEIALPVGRIDAAKVFLRGAAVDFEHLALVLVDMHRSETLAPYLGVIRHELQMPAAANALFALEARLFPADKSERPPARAPGIARLRKALKRLTTGDAPEITLDAMTKDLRFLRLFERTEHVLRRSALDRLLADVANADGPAVQPKPARIIKLHRREDA